MDSDSNKDKKKLIKETNAQFLDRMKNVSIFLEKIKIDIKKSNSNDLPKKH